MNDRERFRAAMHHQPVDRVPYHEWWFWPETLERWHQEGLPRDADLGAYFGFDRSWGYKQRELVAVNIEMVPPFPEEVLRDEGLTRVVRDRRGIIKRVHAHRTGVPQWLDFPVKGPGDLRRIHRRFDAVDPGRYPADWADRVRAYGQRDYPLCLDVGGFFGHGRYLMGDERLLCAFLDEPALVEEMFEFRTQFILDCIRRAVEEVQIDYAWYWEDMAYRGGSLISPALFRRFMAPQYRRINDCLGRWGIDVVFVDSDGDIRQLIPLWLECGVNGFAPLEVQAGMDPVALKRQYGSAVRLMGGIDKRELAKDRPAIRREVEAKVPHLIEAGGCIPTLDHSVPPDVPLANYLYYWELVRKIAE
jgi:uroporphyrinogen-III decarboxylase